MRYLVVSDVHGRDLSPLRQHVEHEGFDVFLFLGDLDLMQSIRQVKALQTLFKEERTDAFLVPGNHDHALYVNLDISSGTLRQEGVNMQMLRRALDQDPELERFLADLVEGRDPDAPTPHSKTVTVNGFDTVLVHGGVTGSLHSFPGCPGHVQDLWRRLRGEEAYRDTYRFMEQHGYDLLLRGHDHTPRYVTWENEAVTVHQVGDGDEYRLHPGDRHVVTVGAYYDGWYTTIATDQDAAVVGFHTV